jgi:hypothetical protein
MYNPFRMMVRLAALLRTLALVLPIAIFGSFLGCVWTCTDAPEESLNQIVGTVEAACGEDCGIESTPGALPTKERNDRQPEANSQLAGLAAFNELRPLAPVVSITPVSQKDPPLELLLSLRI